MSILDNPSYQIFEDGPSIPLNCLTREELEIVTLRTIVETQEKLIIGLQSEGQLLKNAYKIEDFITRMFALINTNKIWIGCVIIGLLLYADFARWTTVITLLRC